MTHTGRHFLQIPGPTNVPDRVLKEIAQATIDHRGPEFAELGLEVLERPERHLPHARSCCGVPCVRHRCGRSGAREYAVARRSHPDFRNRLVLAHRVAAGRGAARPERRIRAGHMAARRVAGNTRAAPEGRHGARAESRRRRAQRNVDRRRQPHRRSSARDEPERPSGAADRRRDFIARVDRSAARRVGDRRHGVRLAERA